MLLGNVYVCVCCGRKLLTLCYPLDICKRNPIKEFLGPVAAAAIFCLDLQLMDQIYRYSRGKILTLGSLMHTLGNSENPHNERLDSLCFSNGNTTVKKQFWLFFT